MGIIPIHFRTTVISGRKGKKKREGFSCTCNVIFIKINKRKQNLKDDKMLTFASS